MNYEEYMRQQYMKSLYASSTALPYGGIGLMGQLAKANAEAKEDKARKVLLLCK